MVRVMVLIKAIIMVIVRKGNEIKLITILINYSSKLIMVKVIEIAMIVLR